jgi:hypothetical protein
MAAHRRSSSVPACVMSYVINTSDRNSYSVGALHESNSTKQVVAHFDDENPCSEGIVCWRILDSNLGFLVSTSSIIFFCLAFFVDLFIFVFHCFDGRRQNVDASILPTQPYHHGSLARMSLDHVSNTKGHCQGHCRTSNRSHELVHTA